MPVSQENVAGHLDYPFDWERQPFSHNLRMGVQNPDGRRVVFSNRNDTQELWVLEGFLTRLNE